MTKNILYTLLSLFSTTAKWRIVRPIGQIIPFLWQQPLLASSLLITISLLGVRQMEFLQPLELAEFDRMTQLKPDSGIDPRLLIVEITEKDIQAQKRWPISDLTIATLIAKLQSFQPKAIGLDIHRDLPQPPGRQELLKQLQATNVIVITKLTDLDKSDIPPPPGVPKERIGFNDFILDLDGVIRRNLMYAEVDKKPLYSFSLQVSLNYLKDKNNTLKIKRNSLQISNTKFLSLTSNSGGYQNIDSQGYQILLKYRSRNIANQVTLTEVLQGKINPDWVKDKVVLIGTTAPSQKDIFFTPYNATDREKAMMPGVTVHAQMVSQILSKVLDDRSQFWFWPQWGEYLWIWSWSLVGAILVWRFRHPLALGLAGSTAVTGLFAICFTCFIQSGWIPFVVPVLAMLGTGVTMVVYKLFHDAFYDNLTNLPNRKLFLKRLTEFINNSKLNDNFLLAVIFLDLDRFKIINESFGHHLGDLLLLSVTQRLKDNVQKQNTVARIGGDEFAILLTNIRDINQVTSFTDELQTKLALPFNIKGQEVFTSASFGIAFNQAGHDYQPTELLRDAHTAMYRAKALGKGRYEVFSTGMRTQVVTRLQLETDLRRAINSLMEGTSQEFSVYYQPIVCLTTGKIAGFEALVRWQNSQGKFISPAEFIPVAEETGSIVQLGEWILRESCRQLQIWQEKFKMQPPLMLSVNLSSQQFSQPNLTDKIEQILKETQLNGRNLKLEITESMAMNDVESTIAKILVLKTLNLRFSIDDFGTGYSSLSYLHRFPVDTLKVDRSFVSRMGETAEDAAIVQTIVMLSHNLGMDVVAEGVETEAQMEKLRSLKCEYGQGYFFSKPLNQEAATSLLASQPKW